MNNSWINRMPRVLRALCSTALLLAFAPAQGGEAFPGSSITLVSAFPPGSVIDTVSRIVGERIKGHFGVPVVVVNRPGASSMIGTEFVINAPPDGNTWVLTSSLLPTFKAFAAPGALKFDPVTDLAHVGLICRSFNFLVTPRNLGVQSVKQFVDLAKSKPGDLTYGHSGIGSTPHLGFELFKIAAGINVRPIPYQAMVQLLPDFVRGDVSSMIVPAQVVLANHQSGNMNILAVVADKRYEAFPDVPTIVEAGYPTAQASSWFGLALPPKTPQAIIDRISVGLEKMVADPELKGAMKTVACLPESRPKARMQAMIRDETATWIKVKESAGIR